MKYLTSKAYWPLLAVFDAFGNIFMKKHRQPPEILRKALFIRLEHIGDMVMATPVFESFKKSNPECEIHVLCQSLTTPLIRFNPFVDKIIEFDAPWFSRKSVKKNDIKDILKKEKYDIVFEMHGDPRNLSIAHATGGYVVGYACRGGGFLINKKMPYDPKAHMISQNMTLVSDYINSSAGKMKIYTDKKSRAEAVSLMRKNELKRCRFVVIQPRTGRPEKDLTDQEVANFVKSSKLKVVITGSIDDVKRNEAFSSLPNSVNLTGKTSLLGLVELVKMAQSVLAADTGIVHISGAVGKKCRVIYKTTDRKVWGYE